jgi:hypothetical protein
MTDKDAAAGSAADDPNESRVNMLALSVAVPVDEMPKFLQERMQATPAVVTLAEVQQLDEPTRADVLATVERAVAHYREAADHYRARTNPAQRTADQLEAFLEAARK